jgi:2-iminobutanoate/2-iminopropanoate deaminase
MIKVIDTNKAPKAIGPYSQGISANGFYFFSGQIPIDPVTGEIVNGGIQAEVAQVLKNISAMLDAAKLNSADIVKTTIFLTDLNNFKTVNEAYATMFKNNYFPARSTIQVAALPKGAQVEIEIIACNSK